MSIGTAREITAKWYYKDLWGWDLNKICEGTVRETLLKSMLVCANGDGTVSADERAWVIGRAAAAGAPDSLLKELESYPANEDINDVVSRTMATDKSRRCVVYFAIKAASADREYGAGEQAKIRSVAKSMGISEDVVAQIEQQVRAEDDLKHKRIALCFPDGNPFGL